MDNAVLEVLQEHNGGLLVWVYEFLWKPLPDRCAISARYQEHLPQIPHTIIFNYSRAQHWYYTVKHVRAHLSNSQEPRSQRLGSEEEDGVGSETAVVEGGEAPTSKLRAKKFSPEIDPDAHRGPQGQSGEEGDPQPPASQLGNRRISPPRPRKTSWNISKMPRKSLIATEIMNTLCPKRTNGISIVAQMAIKQTDTSAVLPVTRYFTEVSLAHQLFHETVAEPAVLQSFVVPKSGGGDVRNVSMMTRWQSNYCYVEKCVNLFPLLSDESTRILPSTTVKSAQERGETVEGTKSCQSSTLANGPLLTHIRDACNAIAERVYLLSEIHIRSMSLVLKTNDEDSLLLHWCFGIQGTTKETILKTLSTIQSSENVPESTGSRSSSTPFFAFKSSIGSTDFSTNDDSSTTGSGSPLSPKPRNTSQKRSATSVGHQQKAKPFVSHLDDDPCFIRSAAERQADRVMFRWMPQGPWRPKDRCLLIGGYHHHPNSNAMPPLNEQRASPNTGNTNNATVSSPVSAATSFRHQQRRGKILNTRYVTETITGAWGAPSMSDNVLLKKGSLDGPFACERLAHSVGSLGLREKYLVTMRQAE